VGPLAPLCPTPPWRDWTNLGQKAVLAEKTAPKSLLFRSFFKKAKHYILITKRLKQEWGIGVKRKTAVVPPF